MVWEINVKEPGAWRDEAGLAETTGPTGPRAMVEGERPEGNAGMN